MVQKTITIMQLQQRLRSVIDEVAKARAVYVVTRDRQAAAALVPYEHYQDLRRQHETEAAFGLDRVLKKMRRQNASRTEDEVRKAVRLARAQVRRSWR